MLPAALALSCPVWRDDAGGASASGDVGAPGIYPSDRQNGLRVEREAVVRLAMNHLTAFYYI